MLSRRNFVRVSSFSVGALALARSLGAQQASSVAGQTAGQVSDAPGSSHAIFSDPENTFLASHDMLSQSAFTSQVGSVFHVVLADRTRLPMRLMSVAPLAGPTAAVASSAGAARQGAGQMRAGSLWTPGVNHLSAREAASRTALQNAFRVLFRMQGTGQATQLAQGSYVVESGVFGPAAMFLVPGGDPAAPTCSAVFLSTPMV